MPLEPFLEVAVRAIRRSACRAPRCSSPRRPDATPHALLHSLKHYKVLHERNVFLTVEFRDVPWVPFEERVVVRAARRTTAGACACATASWTGPTWRSRWSCAAPLGLEVDPMETSYFLSREKIVPASPSGGMARWRDRLFAAMARNAGSVTDFFNIPTNRVVELGTRVEI